MKNFRSAIPSIYDFSDYKKYLSSILDHESFGRGARSRLAALLKCGSAFVSQVLQGSAHFSLEHSILAAEFLGLNSDETQFLLLLHQKGRAGSRKLEDHFQKQIQEVLAKRRLVSDRVGKSERLSFEDESNYYSSWFLSAIHVALAIPEIKTRQQLAERFGIPSSKVQEALEFLESRGLVELKNGSLRPTSKRLHLDNNSPMISKHHANWRLKALQSLELQSRAGLHFSGVWSFARKDVEALKKVFLDAIERAEPILRPSPEETVYGIAIDFFPLFIENDVS